QAYITPKKKTRSWSPRRLLVVAALTEAPVELGEHVTNRDVAMSQRDHQMIDEVRRLADHARVGLGVDRARQLVGFFTQLFADAERAALVEALRVALLAGARLARLELGLEREQERPPRAPETSLGSGMARRPGGTAEIERRVLVAVEPHLAHLDRVAAGLALHPRGLTRPREKRRALRLARPLERLRVGVREHSHLAGEIVLNDHRHQPGRIELHRSKHATPRGMGTPSIAFATPRKLPRASDLHGRVVVLDVAFASEASGGGFEK